MFNAIEMSMANTIEVNGEIFSLNKDMHNTLLNIGKRLTNKNYFFTASYEKLALNFLNNCSFEEFISYLNKRTTSSSVFEEELKLLGCVKEYYIKKLSEDWTKKSKSVEIARNRISINIAIAINMPYEKNAILNKVVDNFLALNFNSDDKLYYLLKFNSTDNIKKFVKYLFMNYICEINNKEHINMLLFVLYFMRRYDISDLSELETKNLIIKSLNYIDLETIEKQIHISNFKHIFLNQISYIFGAAKFKKEIDDLLDFEKDKTNIELNSDKESVEKFKESIINPEKVYREKVEVLPTKSSTLSSPQRYNKKHYEDLLGSFSEPAFSVRNSGLSDSTSSSNNCKSDNNDYSSSTSSSSDTSSSCNSD